MQDKRTGSVYEIRGPNKSYVGSTINSPMGRWKTHVWMLEQGKHHCEPFQDLWNKHSITAFSFHILEANIEKDNLGDREVYWAKRNNAFASNATQKRWMKQFIIDRVIYELKQGSTYRQIAKKYKIALGTIGNIKNRYM